MRSYTNAATIIDERVRRHRGPRRAVLGLGPGARAPTTPPRGSTRAWRSRAAAGRRSGAGEQAHGAHGGELEGGRPREDPTLQHPRCVFQLLRRHFRRYTPEMVERTCGVPQRRVPEEVAEALCENSGRERTSAFCYSVGLDPAHGRRPVHPHGRDHPAAARQHRAPGRGDPRAARARVDPGLDRHPHALQHPAGLPADAARGTHATLADYVEHNTAAHRLLGPRGRVPDQPAEGVVGRRRHRGQRLLLRLPAAHHRRPLDLSHDDRACATAR